MEGEGSETYPNQNETFKTILEFNQDGLQSGESYILTGQDLFNTTLQ